MTPSCGWWTDVWLMEGLGWLVDAPHVGCGELLVYIQRCLAFKYLLWGSEHERR
jgi:hypothetical protein